VGKGASSARHVPSTICHLFACAVRAVKHKSPASQHAGRLLPVEKTHMPYRGPRHVPVEGVSIIPPLLDHSRGPDWKASLRRQVHRPGVSTVFRVFGFVRMASGQRRSFSTAVQGTDLPIVILHPITAPSCLGWSKGQIEFRGPWIWQKMGKGRRSGLDGTVGLRRHWPDAVCGEHVHHHVYRGLPCTIIDQYNLIARTTKSRGALAHLQTCR